MKNVFSLLLCIVILSCTALPCFALDETQQPVIIDTVYPTDDIVIADIIATKAPYNADPSGKSDSTAAIQKAIDDCAANGGGTVWLPEGKYRLTGEVYIRQFVTLRGEYQDPDEGTEYGTVIIADVESSDAMTPGLIRIGGSAGAVGLTVWYPDQSIENVKPYPYTFYVEGNGDYMLHTLKNCTLLNSYRGIGASSECENNVYQCHEMFTIENVKGTCLCEGLNSHNSADVDTVKTLYFLNKYWLEAGEEYNAPDKEKLDAYTRANTIALVFGDLEWPQFADIKISQVMGGMLFKKGIRYCFSGAFNNIYITDADYGMYILQDAIHRRGESWGIGITNGVIQGSKYAVYTEDNDVIILTNVEVEGEIIDKNLRSYTVDTSVYSPDYKMSYTKPEANLYVVSADKTGKTDASAAVQAKLNEAAATGGVVYLPGGLYRFDNPVTVPAGVEFRGSSSVPTRCQRENSSGTLIISYYGYDKSASPLITLGKGAGLNGIRVDYPLNNPVDESGKYLETAPVVYSNSDNVYVSNCFLTLASCGVKLENADNAFIKKVVGCCYDSMFDLSGCENAFIEGCLQNANSLPRTGYANFDIPEMQNRIEEANLFKFVFIPITRIRTDYIKLNSCTNVTVFNTFIYGGKTFLNSTDSTVNLINVGHDGSSKTEHAFIMSGGEVTLVNSMRSTEDGKLGYRFYTADNGCKFRSYNSLSVDMLYREQPVLANIRFDELEKSEIRYWLLQPLYKFISFFGNIHMNAEQG
ncbi:MAG: hypothetical protein IKK49_07435 [Clostridia bacterium]|nr:hypothetical protein [Clostridia bacterium]